MGNFKGECMNKKLFISFGLFALIAVSIAFGAYAATDIKLFINGKKIDADLQIVDGSSYVPLRVVSESLGAEVAWDDNTRTITINSKNSTPPSEKKDLVTKSDLPYTINASNGMSLTINSYTASNSGVTINVTIKNNSTSSDKGDLMTSTWEIYDGQSTLKFLDQDKQLWDISYLRSGQAVTGDLKFKGLTDSSATSFSLFGGLWQYIDREEFKITFER